VRLRIGFGHVGVWAARTSPLFGRFNSTGAPSSCDSRGTAARVRPSEAFYSEEFNNFLLLHDDVRTAADPKAMVLDFLQSTCEAAATSGHWDREALEYR
jgi:Family of unknown function (DUF5996)